MKIYCDNKDCGLSVNGICKSNKLELLRDKDVEDCNVLVCMSHEWNKVYEPIEPK